MKKTSLALALAALTTAAPMTYAVDYSIWGEIYVELTDTDGDEDLKLDVTTADFGFEITEEFDGVDVTGHLDFADGDYDVAGITVAGSFGSVYIGDDGTGVLAADLTDSLENNSEVFYKDDSAEVIDYGLPLSGPFSANIFVGISDFDNIIEDDPTTMGVDESAASEEDDEDFDFSGVYGSYSAEGITLAFGYTSVAESTSTSPDYDSIVDLAAAYETGPIYVAVGYQDIDGDDEAYDDSIMSITATYSAGAISVTPYYEEFGDADVTAFNVTYGFTDNFYAFVETADYSEESGKDDNSEIGLVLNF